MLQRFGPPHKLDEAPHGTRLRVDQGDTFDIYIQVSSNESDPQWELLGNFTEESYRFYKSAHRNESTPKSV